MTAETSALSWYQTVLRDIIPHINSPDLFISCALAVDDPVAAVALRMSARINAGKAPCQVARWHLRRAPAGPAGQIAS